MAWVLRRMEGRPNPPDPRHRAVSVDFCGIPGCAYRQGQPPAPELPLFHDESNRISMKNTKREKRLQIRERRQHFTLDKATAKMICQLGLFGHTNKEIALIFGVSESTLARRLREQHIEAEATGAESVLTALKKARDCADAEVVHALYNRATGFRLGDTYYPPDTTAAIFWLKNRQPGKWRDRTETRLEVEKAPPVLNIVIESGPKNGLPR